MRKHSSIIQITDMHLFEKESATLLGVNTWASFNAVVDLVKKNHPNPDVMFLTGDLAQDETIGAYEKLTQRLGAFHCPKYGIPGNHDNDQSMATIFKAHHFQENKELVINNWNCILLNTQKPRAVEGLLSEEQLHFLDQSLGQLPTHHTLIFLHHPPVPIGAEWIDKLMLSNHEAFWEVLSCYNHIKGIFCGHVHQEFTGEKNNIPVLTSPSTCFQFTRNSQKFGVENLAPGYRAIHLYEDGHFDTTVHRVVGFDLNLDIHSKGY